MRNDPRWCLILFVIVVSSAEASAESDRATSRPNIIFVLADDLGWVDNSAALCNHGNNSRFYETPNLAKMTSEGLSFTRAYAAPNCAPTRAMLATGQYMTRTQVYNVGNLNRGRGLLRGPEQRQDVKSDAITLAETLKASGYVTAHFGKYHIGGHEGGNETLPENQGFDHNFGGGRAGHPASYWPISRGTYARSVGVNLYPFAMPYDADFMSEYRTYSTDGRNRESTRLTPSLLNTPKHLGDAMGEAAVAFLRDQIAAHRPFYLQYHAFLVHTPIESRPDLEEHYRKKKQLGRVDPRGHTNASYAAMVHQLDQQLGRLMQTVVDPNQDGNESDSVAAHTLIVFTSDNGGHAGPTDNRPLRGRKGMLTEGGIRVPLVAWQPGTIPAGTTSNRMVNSVDFYPTISGLAQAALPDPATHPLDGSSFAQELVAPNTDEHAKTAFWHFPGYLDTRAKPTSVISRDVLVDGDYRHFKLWYDYESERYALYDLSDDLGESQDLLATGALSFQVLTVADTLSRQLRRWLDTTGAIYPLRPEANSQGEPVLAPVPVSHQSHPIAASERKPWKIELLSTPHDVSFRGLCVVDDQTVWASGQRGTVVRSTDGGTTWERLELPDSQTLDYRDIHAFDRDTALAFSAGSPGRVMSTTDGGQTWVERYRDDSPDTFFDAAAFWGPRDGLVFGDPREGRLLLVETSDGGETWRDTTSRSGPHTLPGEAGFAASGTCLAVHGDGHVWIGLGGSTGQMSRVAYSRDGGETWHWSTTPIRATASSGIFSLCFRDQQHGVAVGGDYIAMSDRTSCIAVTDDGGVTWRVPRKSRPAGYRSAVAHTMVGGRSVWIACGPGGCDISQDDGDSWRPLESGGYHAISFAPSGFGVSIGADGMGARWLPTN